jgi:integrase
MLTACQAEPLRNRLMFALAYDGSLRREELVSLEIDDLEPAWSLIHLRAAGPTPEEIGTDRAFIALTTVQDSITGGQS